MYVCVRVCVCVCDVTGMRVCVCVCLCVCACGQTLLMVQQLVSDLRKERGRLLQLERDRETREARTRERLLRASQSNVVQHPFCARCPDLAVDDRGSVIA